MKLKSSTMNSKTKKPSKFFRDLHAAVVELKQIERGERAPSRQWKIVPDGKGGFIRRQLTPRRQVLQRPAQPGATLALAARMKLKLSQRDFAALLGVADGTLKGWEQGRREPNRAARVLLAVATLEPEAVLAAAKAA